MRAELRVAQFHAVAMLQCELISSELVRLYRSLSVIEFISMKYTVDLLFPLNKVASCITKGLWCHSLVVEKAETMNDPKEVMILAVLPQANHCSRRSILPNSTCSTVLHRQDQSVQQF